MLRLKDPAKQKQTGKDRYVVDIRDHHCQCELNFHMLMKMLPGCREGSEVWSFWVGSDKQVRVNLSLLESAPYTSTVEITQVEHKSKPIVDTPTMRVRLYHDVEMAEVVGWDRHTYWLSEYEYPNQKMYQVDEKLVLNRFFGEWLGYCRKQGIYADNIVKNFS